MLSCKAFRLVGLVRVALIGFLSLALILPETAYAGRSITSDKRYAAIVIDAHTNKVLYSRGADRLRFPASLTKMMTLYMVFGALKSGRFSKSSRVRFSKYASARPPSKLGIKAGRSISLESAILALVTKSANDVAAAVAEKMSGSESKFARDMTRKARQLGMKNTTFRNASGLPNSSQKTTARDMATLAKALRRDFPQYFHYFKRRNFSYGGRRYRNHNKLLGSYPGVNGIKTGYTRASGFNLTTTVQHKNKYVIAVVMGGPTGRARDSHMRYLLNRYVPRAVARRSSPNRVNVNVASMPVPTTRPVKSKPTVVAQAKPKAVVKPVAKSETVAKQEPVQIAVNKPLTAYASSTSSKPIAVGAPKKAVSAAKVAQTPAKVAAATAATTVAQKPEEQGSTSTLTAEELNSRSAHAALKNKMKIKPWLIQIGAFNNEQDARDRIGAAMRSNHAQLSKHIAYTETVETSARTLYRARFAGFDRYTARKTCSMLKRAKISCIPMKEATSTH